MLLLFKVAPLTLFWVRYNYYANLYKVLFLPNIIITYANHYISFKKQDIS